MEIEIVRDHIDPDRLVELVRQFNGEMVKLVVDLKRGIIAIGGSMHADAEAELLEDGSRQPDLWGANYYPEAPAGRRIEYESLINVRPQVNNRTMHVEDPGIRNGIRRIVEERIGEA